MKPWIELDRARLHGGEDMILCRRGNEFVIRVGAHELMGSRSHASEDQLALLGCAGLRARPGARVLIGGLGMGFSRYAPRSACSPTTRRSTWWSSCRRS